MAAVRRLCPFVIWFIIKHSLIGIISSKHVIRSSHSSERKQSSDIVNFLKSTDDDEDYDAYGCCLTCGYFYCHSSKMCISDWDGCDLGSYNSSSCQFHYNNTVDGFTYDLSEYIEDINGFYKITDEVSHPQQTFEYYFNLCTKVKSSNLPSVCSSTTGSSREVCSSDALAYQYFSTDWGYEACYRLSNCDKTSTSSQSVSCL